MPWRETNTMDLRTEFVHLAASGGITMTELCRRFNISRKTGYKWLSRYQQRGLSGLKDLAKVPVHQPARTPADIESLIVSCRDRYPDWGPRKLRRVLQNQGYQRLPVPSTITEVLRRHNKLNDPSTTQAPFIRFEHPYPNDLWQMDFKGHFRAGRQRCHPLTMLDDCSRFSLCLQACSNEQAPVVRKALVETFQRFGLPRRMTMDNGSPWGSAGVSRFSALTVWLIEQGICVGHSRPYHPQTQGKNERFHRTLKSELLGRRELESLEDCQRAFDQWRDRYNTIRPHEALGLQTPASRYESSHRPYNESLAEYEYGESDQVRKVGPNLCVSFQRCEIMLGSAFVGKHIALRPAGVEGHYTLHFCHQQIGKVDMRELSKRK